MPDLRTELIKINALLENIGYQLSRIKKDPSLERKLEDVINNNISDITRFTLTLVNSGEVTNQKLLTALQSIKCQEISNKWAEYSTSLKKYVNNPEYTWDK